MPLGELQKNMHLGESLPIVREINRAACSRQRKNVFGLMDTQQGVSRMTNIDLKKLVLASSAFACTGTDFDNARSSCRL